MASLNQELSQAVGQGSPGEDSVDPRSLVLKNPRTSKRSKGAPSAQQSISNQALFRASEHETVTSHRLRKGT